MDSGFCAHDHLHLLGDSATHPIEPRWRTLSGVSMAGVGAAFWGVLAGALTLAVQHWRPLR